MPYALPSNVVRGYAFREAYRMGLSPYRRLLLAATCVLGAGAKDLKAAVFYWDGANSSANADGGSGTWNTSLTNWDNAATGGASVVWANVTSSDAVFGGVAGTVTVGTVTANDLTFNTTGYVLSGGTITLNRPNTSDNPNITIAAGVTTTVASTLAGTRTITKDGTGKLVLSGANTFSGALTISQGVVNIRNATALGTTGGATTVSAGAALEIQDGVSVGGEALTLNGSGVGGAGALRNISGSNSISGAITLGSATTVASDSGLLTLSGNIGGAAQNLTVSAVGDVTLSGALGTGAGTLTKNGAGTLTLSGSSANTFTGQTTLSEGRLVLSKTAGVNALAGAVSVAGGTLALGASNQIAATAVTVNSGTFDIASYSDTVGAVTLAGGAITGTTGVLTGSSYAVQSGSVSAILGGTGTLTKTTGGTVTLSGANSYTGITTVSAGVLNIRSATALGTTAGGTTVAAGAALEIQGGISVGAEAMTLNGTGVAGNGALRNVSGLNTISGAITLGSATLIRSDSGLLTLTGNITGTNTNLTFDGAGDVLLKTGTVNPGTATILKTGTGTLTLQGSTGATGTAFEAREGLAVFDYSLSNTTRVGNTATLTFSGGTVGVIGGSGPDNLLSTTFTRGASKLVRLPGDTGTSSIRLNALTRSVGATFDVNGAALADTDTVNTNGLIGGWFTLAGKDFASNSVSVDGPLVTPTYVNDTWAAGNNTNVTTGGVISAGTTNSLRFNAAGATTLTLSGAGTIQSGGLLVTSGVGSYDTTLTGGTLRGSASGDLVVHQYNTSGDLVIASAIVDNGGATALTKAGSGNLVLSGANTFTGRIYLNEGDLKVTSLADGGSPSSLGASSKSASNLLLGNEATFSYAGAASGSTDRSFTAAGSYVTIASNGVGTLSFTDSVSVAFDTPNVDRTIALAGTNAGDNIFTLTLGDNGTAQTSLIKNGIGKWVLSGLNGYTGQTTVNAGTLLQNGSAAGSAHTVNASGTLGGTGTVGAVALNSGGFIAPGMSGAIGTLQVNGDLTWNGGATMLFDLGAAGASDRINIGGSLVRGAAGGYGFDFGGTGQQGVYTLVSGTGASDFTADQFFFQNLAPGLSGFFSFAGNNLIFTAIPEPRDYALSAGALAALAAGVRRRRLKKSVHQAS